MAPIPGKYLAPPAYARCSTAPYPPLQIGRDHLQVTALLSWPPDQAALLPGCSDQTAVSTGDCPDVPALQPTIIDSMAHHSPLSVSLIYRSENPCRFPLDLHSWIVSYASPIQISPKISAFCVHDARKVLYHNPQAVSSP